MTKNAYSLTLFCNYKKKIKKKKNHLIKNLEKLIAKQV